MAFLYDIHIPATGLRLDGRVLACAAGAVPSMIAGENADLRHRGGTDAGRISALVARCMR